MAGIFILMLLFTLVLFILTRTVWINVIKDDGIRLELHLPILAICLIKSKNSTKNKKSKRKSSLTHRNILKSLLKLTRNSEIIIKRIEFPRNSDELSSVTFTRPYRYQGAFFALYAYLKTKTEKLTLCDNAIALSSDSETFRCDFTVKLRLYRLIFTALAVLYGGMKEKLKKGLANV